MTDTTSLDNATAALTALQTQIAGERAAVLAEILPPAAQGDMLAANSTALAVTPKGLSDFFTSPLLTTTAIFAALRTALAPTASAITNLIAWCGLSYLPQARIVFVDPVAGSDAVGNGQTAATAYASVEKAVAMANAGQVLSILLCNNTTVQGFRADGLSQIVFNSQGGPWTLTFGAAAAGLNSGPSGASANMLFNSPCSVFFNNVNVAQGPVPAMAGGQPVLGSILMTCGGQIIFGGQTFTRDAACVAPLVAGLTHCTLTFTAAVFSTTGGGTWPGNIFHGIAAGANPNSDWRYATNLTSG